MRFVPFFLFSLQVISFIIDSIPSAPMKESDEKNDADSDNDDYRHNDTGGGRKVYALALRLAASPLVVYASKGAVGSTGLKVSI